MWTSGTSRGYASASAATRAAPEVSSSMSSNERYRPIADALVAALTAAQGDADREHAAIQQAIDDFMAIAGDGDPGEHGLAEYFCENGSVDDPPAIERVPGASEDDIFRWRELMADLAGY